MVRMEIVYRVQSTRHAKVVLVFLFQADVLPSARSGRRQRSCSRFQVFNVVSRSVLMLVLVRERSDHDGDYG